VDGEALYIQLTVIARTGFLDYSVYFFKEGLQAISYGAANAKWPLSIMLYMF
jgi:hypothetical protein